MAICGLLKHHYHTREGRTILMPSKLYSSSYESHFCFIVNIFVEPLSVRPSRKQAYADIRPTLRSFANPITNNPSIRRVHKHPFTRPILSKAVVFFGVELGALVVFLGRAWVERKCELAVQFIEQLLWCRPFNCCARKVYIHSVFVT